MKRNIFILHGTDGNPKENWFPWLKEKLEAHGHTIIVPQFPDQDHDSLAARLTILDRYEQYINEQTIIIGHSRGGLFLFRILEKITQPIYAAFFVSASVGIKPYSFYDSGFKFAGGYQFDWEKIRKMANHIVVYHSDDDPYTCLDNGKVIAKKLKVNLTFIPQSGHFNTRSGYTQFQKLLDDLNQII